MGMNTNINNGKSHQKNMNKWKIATFKLENKTQWFNNQTGLRGSPADCLKDSPWYTGMGWQVVVQIL